MGPVQSAGPIFLSHHLAFLLLYNDPTTLDLAGFVPVDATRLMQAFTVFCNRFNMKLLEYEEKTLEAISWFEAITGTSVQYVVGWDE